MIRDVAILMTKRADLSAYAQELRRLGHNQHTDMLKLAKVLSRQAQLDMQLAGLGVPIIPAETQSMATDEDCPF